MVYIMFEKLLRSIVSDINLLYAKDSNLLSCEQLNKFMDAINYKIQCIKGFDVELWRELSFHTATYRTDRKIIKNYLKTMERGF